MHRTLAAHILFFAAILLGVFHETALGQSSSDEIDISIENTKLLPLSFFGSTDSASESTWSATNISVDSRRFDVMTLSSFELKRSLEIDVRVNKLRILAGFNRYSLHPQVASLTPIGAFKNSLNIDSPQVEEIELPELEPVDSGPTLYLNDFQTAWVSDLVYDENVFLDDQNGSSSIISTNDLTTSATFQRRKNTYLASIGVVHREYDVENVASQTDYRAYLNAFQELGRRHSASISWQVDRSQEARGTGLLEGLDDDDIQSIDVDKERLTIDHKLGDDQSRMQLRTSLNNFKQRYEEIAGITDVSNYDTRGLDTQLSFRSGPNTRWLGSFAWDDIDHKDDNLEDLELLTTLDASSRTVTFGVERNIARHSSLTIEYGRYHRSFDATDRSDENMSIWNAEFAWNPKTYSRVSMSYGRQFRPSRGEGSFIDSTESQVRWLHEWNQKFKTQFSYSLYEDNYVDSSREDVRTNYSAMLTYAFSENWRLALGYRYSEKNSTSETFSYEKSSWFLRSNLRF